MSEIAVYYLYPLLIPITLGFAQSGEVDIAPDIPLQVTGISCNIPSASMVIIKESPIFYEHDPWSMGLMDGLPIKHQALTIQKKWLKKLHYTYSGHIHRGYVAGHQFIMQYRFQGKRVSDEQQ